MTPTAPPSSRTPHKAAARTYGLRDRLAGRIANGGVAAGVAAGGVTALSVGIGACAGTGGSARPVPAASSAGGATNFVPQARHTTASPASLSGSRIDFPHDEHLTL